MAGQVEVGRRYLHGKTRSPLTVRYIGPLPPTLTKGPGSNAERIGETSHDGPSRLDNWIGVEYDDPSKGKHSGTYEGRQVFKVRREGAGAFIRDKPGALIPGKTFVEALEERYGAIAGYVGDNPASIDTRPGETKEDGVALKPSSQLVLGSSGGAILVEAPNLDRVKRKMSQLESLKQIGFEDEHIIELGGNEDTKSILRVRVKGGGPSATEVRRAEVVRGDRTEPVQQPDSGRGNAGGDRGLSAESGHFGPPVSHSARSPLLNLSAIGIHACRATRRLKPSLV